MLNPSATGSRMFVATVIQATGRTEDSICQYDVEFVVKDYIVV